MLKPTTVHYRASTVPQQSSFERNTVQLPGSHRHTPGERGLGCGGQAGRGTAGKATRDGDCPALPREDQR